MLYGGLAELVDALDLGSSVERRAGSSPVSPTMASKLGNEGVIAGSGLLVNQMAP